MPIGFKGAEKKGDPPPKVTQPLGWARGGMQEAGRSCTSELRCGPVAVETERTVCKSCLCALGGPAWPLCAAVTSTLKTLMTVTPACWVCSGLGAEPCLPRVLHGDRPDKRGSFCTTAQGGTLEDTGRCSEQPERTGGGGVSARRDRSVPAGAQAHPRHRGRDRISRSSTMGLLPEGPIK